ncbi:universal stress protein [bacterium]|nr:universal stress protein [bacterium]
MRILVPLNGRLQSETVLPYVKKLARDCLAEVLLLRVMDPISLTGDPVAAALLGSPHETRERAEEYLQNLASGFEPNEVETLCRVGPASSTICQEATRNRCDLVIFAPHGHAGLERWLFGSVAEEVAHQASCPVLLMKATSPTVFQKILVPTDGSYLSNAVCKHLSRFAPQQVRVTLLHCLDDPPPDKAVRISLEACLAGRPGWSLQIEQGNPSRAILNWAVDSNCDLIAMATHAGGSLKKLWKGSVTEYVARQAPCPVLVFPPAYLEKMAESI